MSNKRKEEKTHNLPSWIFKIPTIYMTYCCGRQLRQKLKITLEALELESITQQLTQNWEQHKTRNNNIQRKKTRSNIDIGRANTTGVDENEGQSRKVLYLYWKLQC